MTEPDDLDELLRAVASRHRRLILCEVWGRERGVGELYQRLGLAPASVSEHLKVLRKTGLVTMRVDRTHRLYRACPERLGRLVELLGEAFPGAARAGNTDTSDEQGREHE